MSGGDYEWSDKDNWSNHAVPVNGAGAVFTGQYNEKCIVDENTTEGEIILEDGYTATITIQNGVTLSIPAYEDVNIGEDNFVLAFAGPDSVNLFDAPGDIDLGHFTWGAGGSTIVNGGTVIIGDGANLQQSTASPVIINNGGGVSIGPSKQNGTSTFYLTNISANINVNQGGQLDFWLPDNNAPLVSDDAEGEQISNGGTTTLNVATGVEGKGVIETPFENHAALHADQGGTWEFARGDANGNDLSMDTGQIYLKGGVQLNIDHNYTQTGGTLYIKDDAQEKLWVTSGAAYFNGGKIVFDAGQNTFGNLSLWNVSFGGVEIDMNISNGLNDISDEIDCVGGNLCQILGQSKLVVTASGPVQKGSNLSWTLIQPSPGNTITGDFNAGNITLPPNVVESASLPNAWECNS